MEDKEYLLREEVPQVALKKMIIPALIAGFITMFNIITDTYFLGNYAADSLNSQAATSTSMSLFFLMSGLSFMLAVGTAVATSQLLGAGYKQKVEQYMANSFVIGWLIYIVLLIILLPNLNNFVSLLTGEASTHPFYTNSYVYSLILVLGFPTVIFTQLSSQTIRAEGKSALIAKLSFIQVVINCIINYFLISDTIPAISFYGTQYEAAGAAIATIASQLFMCLVLMRILFNKEKTNYYINLKNFKLEKNYFIVFKQGIPQFINQVFIGLAVFITSYMAVYVSQKYGFTGDASSLYPNASGIIIKLVLMIVTLSNGAAQGIQGFMAYQFGANRFDRLNAGMKYINKFVFVFSISLFAIFFFGARFIPTIFTTNEQVINLLIMPIEITAIACLFIPLGCVSFGLFASIDKVKYANIGSIIRDGILFCLLSLSLPLLIGPQGVMISSAIAMLLGSIIIIIMFNLTRRTLDK